MLESFIIPGISLGLSAGTLPGPMQTFLINTSLLYGWRKALFVIISPLIVDIPIIILVVFVFGQLDALIINIIRLLGGLFLLWVAWGSWKQFRAGERIEGHTETVKPEDMPSNLRITLTAIMMNFLSPGPYLFWGTVNGPLFLDALELSPLHAIAFLVAFYGTFLGTMFVLSLIFSTLGGISEGVSRIIILFTIGLLIFFGTALIADAFQIAAYQRIAAVIVIIIGMIVWGFNALIRKNSPPNIT